jgi:hypothetical protein
LDVHANVADLRRDSVDHYRGNSALGLGIRGRFEVKISNGSNDDENAGGDNCSLAVRAQWSG